MKWYDLDTSDASGAGTFVDLLFAPNGDTLVLDNAASHIRRYSGESGELLSNFGMTAPKFME